MLVPDDIQVACDRIAGHLRTTPTMKLDEPELPGVAFLILEQTQHTGTFKAPGAFNRQLAADEAEMLDPAVGIVAASGGNSGMAHAYAARELGVPAHVFVPATAPEVKVARLRSYGAIVHLSGTEYLHPYDAAMDHARASGALVCHAYDQDEIVAGAGTIGLEILEQSTGLDTILVAVGGGGLMGGIAAAVGHRIRVIGVEPGICPTLRQALEAGAPVDISVSGVAADSLGAAKIGAIGFTQAVAHGVESPLVTDESISEGRAWMWENQRMALEHGAAAVIAAIRSGAYLAAPGERVGLLLCGANTDPASLVARA
ncbi:threonine/serine dehydratase [Paeniglutamicibacter cryotolerans]|uniref:Threonine dehydratase n=1 Tax=Paeniglutamicibacter cryotolerans TaxID=670079 RepID=A0A839QR39_9MICC|nr:threonine/serine dehydratase [Paeniglutamicibacter cryotolerans]MBB2996456.1 threonine dehydratase [Paeniglutamicibacter cryotolerans]